MMKSWRQYCGITSQNCTGGWLLSRVGFAEVVTTYFFLWVDFGPIPLRSDFWWTWSRISSSVKCCNYMCSFFMVYQTNVTKQTLSIFCILTNRDHTDTIYFWSCACKVGLWECIAADRNAVKCWMGFSVLQRCVIVSSDTLCIVLQIFG